jgi:glycosyltransferase involved in cell wall biosynthesis
VDIVSVQHEFGIFGGPAGSHLLALLRGLAAPVVTTLHTVLLKPNDDQRRVMQELIARSTRLVVMTERAQTILQDVYQTPPGKIDLIPHGIPDVPFVAPECYKDQFGVSGRRVLLTFGLLSPNKGIEHVLNALPDVVAEFPDLVYILLGATHPNELRTRGIASSSSRNSPNLLERQICTSLLTWTKPRLRRERWLMRSARASR